MWGSMPQLTVTVRAGLTFLALSCLGCMRDYVPPTPEQPHAIVKFRRSYENVHGTTLSEVMVLNDERAYQAVDSSDIASAPRTDAILVRPEPARLKLVSQFSHSQSYTATESYSCGTGTNNRTCTRTVTRTRTVVDGYCERELGVVFDQGQNYLLQLNYQDSRNCSALCLIQEPLGDGTFKNRPCATFVIDG